MDRIGPHSGDQFFEAANFLGMASCLFFWSWNTGSRSRRWVIHAPLVLVLMAPAFILPGDVKELNPISKAAGWAFIPASRFWVNRLLLLLSLSRSCT